MDTCVSAEINTENTVKLMMLNAGACVLETKPEIVELSGTIQSLMLVSINKKPAKLLWYIFFSSPH